jgi:aminoglycoside 3-N-acetyltransferase
VRKLTRSDLAAALRAAGIGPGEIAHVQSDLLRIGLVDAPPSRTGMLEFYLSVILEILGPEGTLSVGTSFEDYARFGTPFVREASPSRQGAFSEYVRTRPEAIRSLHPIVSTAAIGPRARELCDQPHFNGFGYESSWGRLHRANAKIVALGLGAKHEGGTTFFHYLEALYGVPYQYVKVYTTPVFSGGREVQGLFTMSVRYLDFSIMNDTLRFKMHLVEKGIARVVPVGSGEIMCLNAADVIDEGIRCLNRDRFFLLHAPPKFRPGEIPLDGNTGPMRNIYDKADPGITIKRTEANT